MGPWMPPSYLVPVNPEFPILRFTSLVSNYCSVPVQQTFLFLCYLLIFICVGGRAIFLPCILVYTSFHFVHEMYVLPSQTKLSWTILSFPVLFKLRKMSDKHCTNIIRAIQIWNSWLTLSSDIQTGSSCCFLISSITLGYQLSMEPAGITAEITTSNVKLCSHFTG